MIVTPEEDVLETQDDSLDYDEDLVEEYFSSTRIKLLFIFILLVVCIVSSLYSMTMYGEWMPLSRVLQLIADHISGAEYEIRSQDWFDDVTVWETALPRLLFAIIAGIGLAVAGASMQSTMNNPLADPYTVGVSSGACLGLAIAMTIGFSVNYGGLPGILTFAFIFAMFPLFAIVVFAPRTRSSPSTLILAGVALSYLFNSLNTIIMVTVDAETLESIYKWQVGSLTGIRWANIPLSFITVTIGTVMVALLSRKLNVLSMGDASASSLGIDPDNLRIICLLAIAFIVGAVVGSAGVIGFVGLVTPHIARMLLGSDNRFVLPASALMSVTFIVLADFLCRILDEYDAIPVGAMIALIGAPIFLYLIVRRKSRVW